MAYIIDNPELLDNELGKMSHFKKKFKMFTKKVHFAEGSKGIITRIKHIEVMANLFRATESDPRMSISFIVLDRGLEIWYHFGMKILSVGIKNSDIIGWKLLSIDSNWYLVIKTHTNMSDNLGPILFFVKNQNLPAVKDYFTKYGFNELLDSI